MAEIKITRVARKLIVDAILETGSKNRYDICWKVNQYIVDKYDGLNLDYQCKRMGIETTKKLLAVIDGYFYKYYKKDFLT